MAFRLAARLRPTRVAPAVTSRVHRAPRAAVAATWRSVNPTATRSKVTAARPARASAMWAGRSAYKAVCVRAFAVRVRSPARSSTAANQRPARSSTAADQQKLRVVPHGQRALSAVPRGKNNRPISPSLQIYKFPIPAISSITNRITGVMMFAGALEMSLLAFVGDCNIPAYVHSFQEAAPVLVPLAKLLVGFPIVYHYAAGARHLYWDYTAKGLDLPSVEQSSKALIAGTAAVSLGLAFYWL